MKNSHLKIAAILSILILFNSCGQKTNLQEKQKTEFQKVTLVKLHPVVFGGNRYVVNADFGLDKEVPLMVHGNASFYLMITHEIAEQLNNGNPIKKLRDYGYSDKGMGQINVEKFRIEDRTFTNVENVRVFDWPEEVGKAAQGMLGIDFLKNEKVRIDFVREQMEIGVELEDEPDKTLLDQGYSYTKFFVENGEGYMNVYFDALEREIPITVGTVSESYSLDAVTFENKIELEITDSNGHSPSGTTPQIYLNTVPVEYKIANHLFEIPAGKADFYSFAEYENRKQADLFPFGIFGRDWMKAHSAIIDYGNKILYFKD